MKDIGYARSAPWGVTLPEGTVRQETNHNNNDRLWEWRQRRGEGDEELVCSQVAGAERLLHDTLVLAS
jgi:hypothetical protein